MISGDWNMQSYTYKTAENCSIQADVYQVNHPKKQPAIVWIHGGALMAGSRADITAYQLEKYLEAGFSVISIDYRLAPETKLPWIIEDLQDAVRWVREKGSDLLAIDPDRLAVIGHSAGGYLVLMAGFVINPPPRAIVSFYGYGDIIGPWYSQPDPWYCKQGLVQEDRAYKSVGRLSLTEADWGKRFPFYLYCRQHGLWPQEVTGQDPQKNPDWFYGYCPMRNVTGNYPPTLLIHGDQDTDVPCELSVEMDSVLAQHQVPHQLQILKGRGHVFDGVKGAHRDPVISRLFVQVEEFLKTNCA
jgi:acetyl esterase/lipase